MSEADRIVRTTRRLPWGLLGMLLLIPAIESALARREVDFTSDPWAWDWPSNARAASRAARGRDILCFGDSLIKFAVMPRVLEHRTGRPTYNLALGGGMAASSYFQLRHALQSGARPRAILVDFWPDLLHKEPIENPRMLSQVATLRDCLELGWIALDGNLLGQVVSGRLLTSARCRFEIRESVRAWVLGGSYSNRGEVLAFQRNWRANAGSMVWPRHPEFVHGIKGEVEKMPGLAGQLWAESLYPDAWPSASSSNRVFMLKFFELAESHEIPVFYVLTPLHPVVQRRRERIGIDESHTRFARALHERFPGVTVVDARRSGYPPWVFTDFIHLDCLGSFEFSDDLADVLNHALDGGLDRPRWVEMPAYHGRPPDVPLEDLNQSRLVLRDQGKTSVR
jgi:hypothetical protein